MNEKDLNGTTVFEEGPIESVTTKVVEEDERLALIREVMEEPRDTFLVNMTVTMRVPLEFITVTVDVGEPGAPESKDGEGGPSGTPAP